MSSKRRAASIACTACLFALAAAQLDPAHIQVAGKEGTYDLTALDTPFFPESTRPSPPSTERLIYGISLFKPLPDVPNLPAIDQCPTGSRICVKIINEKEGQEAMITNVVGIAGDYGEAGALMLTVGAASGVDGLLFTYEGGTYRDTKQKAEITLRCNPDAKDPSQPALTEGTSYTPDSGLLRLTWDSAHACANSNNEQTPPGGDTQQEPTRSVFSIFFWLLVIGFAAYFVVGAWINRSQYGATGADMLPNRDFWRDLPYIVKEFFTPSRSARAGYSSLG